MRVALYARVSTEEQKTHGISIDAQISALRAWAKDNGHEIVGEYVDAGISGKRPYQKRPELLRFMQALDAGLKVDALVFCKLDRFFRSVKLYYQAMDVLDRHHVAWQAIQENHETVSAEGQFRVNLLMSLAEMEVARTSERIKAVMDHKVMMGQPITNALPIGLQIEGKRIVHDNNAKAALAAFEHFAANGNKMGVRNMLQNDFGLKMSITAVDRLLHNRLYIGEYRGNSQYCDPIVPQSLFNRVQHDLEARATRKTPSGRVYLFSGLIICKECGRRMSSSHLRENGDYYRCTCGHGMYHDCSNKTNVREQRLEEQLISALCDVLAGTKVEYRQTAKKPHTANKAAIQAKLDRLKELYIDGDITKEKYRQQRDELTAKLTEPVEKKPGILTVVGDDFVEHYNTLDREKRKLFWRAVIDRIEVGNDGHTDIFFIT